MKTREMPIKPSLLLERDEARLHCLKAALETYIAQFGELLRLICDDLQTTKRLKRKLQGKEARCEDHDEPDILCIKIGPQEEHEQCNCHGRKHRGRR